MKKVSWMGMACGVLVALSAGCRSMGGTSNTTTWPLTASQEFPAAQGDVRIKPQKDGNQEVEVRVRHLAPADQAGVGENYVVWIDPGEGGEPQNMGVLAVNDKLEGRLRTTTPFKRFNVMVTPEKAPRVRVPTNQPVMKAEVVVPERAVR